MKVFDETGKEINYGSVMTRDEFVEACRSRQFVDYDGFGEQLKVRDDNLVMIGNIAVARIWPSQVKQLHDDTTHVVWFNK